MQNYFPSPYGAPPVFGGAPVTWYSGASLPPESGLGKRDGPEHAQDRAACDILQASKRPCLDAHSNTMPHDVLRPPECLVPDALQKRGYLGVRWSHKKNKWRVRIKANGKDNHVGFYSDAASAALAYDKAVQRFNPNWANDPTVKFNFPPHAPEAGAPASGLSLAAASACGQLPVAMRAAGTAALSTPVPVSLANPLAPRGPLSNFGDSRSALDSLRALARIPSPAASLCAELIATVHATSGVTGHSDAQAPGMLSASHHGPSLSPLQYGIGGVVVNGLIGGSPTPSPCPTSTGGSTKLAPLLSQLAQFAAATANKEHTGRNSAEEDEHGQAAGVSSSSSKSQAGTGKCKHEKASLSHLLDDKSSLARTPSPADTVPASVMNMGSASSISTPATLPSPSVILSPVQSALTQPHRSNMDTSPARRGPPRLMSKSQQKRGVISPAVLLPDSQAQSASGMLAQRQNVQKLRGISAEEEDAWRGSACMLAGLKGGQGQAASQCRSQSLLTMSRILEDMSGRCASPGQVEEPGLQKRLPSQIVSNAFTSWNPSSNLQPYVMALHPHVDLGCAGKKEQSEETTASKKKNQSYRGVTWDKVKQMWRVRLCLAGGGREHIGYFSNEEEGALAYQRALQRVKKGSHPGPAIQPELARSAALDQPGAAGVAGACGLMEGLKGMIAHKGQATSHLTTDKSSLPASPSAARSFQAHVNPQVLGSQQALLNLGVGMNPSVPVTSAQQQPMAEDMLGGGFLSRLAAKTPTSPYLQQP